jgi:hypothetical protein
MQRDRDVMRNAVSGIALAAVLAATLVGAFAVARARAQAYSDAQLVDAFRRTVFGGEYASWTSRSVKKFTGPVRFHVEDRSGLSRRAAAERFVRTLPKAIAGLDATLVDDPRRANFRILIIRRGDYRQVVTSEVFGRPRSDFAPGKCLVRLVTGLNGIIRSDAVLVADEGDFLFRRCLVEETLQGLGPVNDDTALPDSVFNDASRHTEFTLHDRHILNMLYDPRIRPGMSRSEADAVLPAVIRDVRRRLGS